MSKLIGRIAGVKKRGTALIVALQLTALTLLSLVCFVWQQPDYRGSRSSGRLPNERGPTDGI
jgi:hypothetical protein